MPKSELIISTPPLIKHFRLLYFSHKLSTSSQLYRPSLTSASPSYSRSVWPCQCCLLNASDSPPPFPCLLFSQSLSSVGLTYCHNPLRTISLLLLLLSTSLISTLQPKWSCYNAISPYHSRVQVLLAAPLPTAVLPRTQKGITGQEVGSIKSQGDQGVHLVSAYKPSHSIQQKVSTCCC